MGEVTQKSQRGQLFLLRKQGDRVRHLPTRRRRSSRINELAAVGFLADADVYVQKDWTIKMDIKHPSKSFPERTQKTSLPVPKGYTYVRVMGKGGFGIVYECVKNKTGEHMVIKVPKDDSLAHEAEILKKLKRHNSDESNIVEYKGHVFARFTRLLVFEKLDITLHDYVKGLTQPMRLEHIRTVIQQLAVALNTTKSAGIIHTDLKTDNIMMVDHVKQPFRVKLIDFGLANYRSEAIPGNLLQTVPYRAPEIILGLPYSEAIDVWSLACVMSKMVAHQVPFGTDSEYYVLKEMIRLLGLPPQHLIRAGRRSRLFFHKIPNGLWRLKTPREYFGSYNPFTTSECHKFRSLDEMKTMYSETDNPAEADERRECIELLKAMVRWNEKDRITPSGILNHPFITKSYLNSSSPISSCNEPEQSTSLFTMVKPADPENRINLTGLPDEDSDLEEKKKRENTETENKKDGYPENIQDRKNSEDNEKPVNKEISEHEDSEKNDTDENTEDIQDRKNSEDNEKPVNKEISEHEDSEKNDTDENTEDIQDRKNSEDNEKPVNKEISEHEDSEKNDTDENTEDIQDRKNSEDNEKPVNKEISEHEDRKSSEDNEKPVNKEISEHEDSEKNDTDENTEDIQDRKNSEDNEKPVNKEISEHEDSEKNDTDENTEDIQDRKNSEDNEKPVNKEISEHEDSEKNDTDENTEDIQDRKNSEDNEKPVNKEISEHEDSEKNDTDENTEDIHDRKNSEDNEKPVNKEISEHEDSEKNDTDEDTEDIQDRKNSEDNEKPVNKEISEHEDSDDTDTDEDTEVSEDSENSDTSDVSKDYQSRKVEQNRQYAEDSGKEQSKKKKKKRNCFQRVFSWMKKTFCCCCCVSDVMD
ncbi:probable serine/threonine-protein kinase dyrk1 [Amphiprion ocellaris]|uniref:probable serine/threonine-protein kinase dyrk1 n=1 Tax=Amphiprion ocellaris TaxID=80972 RepID=UPI002410E41C|nr:probable serine/threonine-protein kinase dyrk1 [Amphiprion ocellaris]